MHVCEHFFVENNSFPKHGKNHDLVWLINYLWVTDVKQKDSKVMGEVGKSICVLPSFIKLREKGIFHLSNLL